jgi:hypothetical protein
MPFLPQAPGLRRGGWNPQAIPLSNVTVRVNLPLKVSTAKALYAAQKLRVRHATGGGVEVLVPRVDIHEVVCFELS